MYEGFRTGILRETVVRLHELDSVSCIRETFGKLGEDAAEISCSFQKLQFSNTVSIIFSKKQQIFVS